MKVMSREQNAKRSGKDQNYILLPQLNWYHENAMKVGSQISAFPLVIGGLFSFYPHTLASLDFWFGIALLAFLFVLKPMMFGGKITAYYRTDYNHVKSYINLVGGICYYGGAMRSPFVMAVFALQAYLSPAGWERNRWINTIKEVILNPSAVLIVLGVSAFTIYLLFYSQRYVSIRDFSNGTYEIAVTQQIPINDAMNKFIQKYAREQSFSDEKIRYDGNVLHKKVSETNAQAKAQADAQVQAQAQAQLEEASVFNFESTKKMRRKPRS